MSQICPSSSHQLVAAAVAFRRARRKFPKNFGLCCNLEETTRLDKTESVSGNEEPNDQENSPFSPRKCTTGSRADAKAVWNDERGEDASIKENLFQKPIVCSCCRKRNNQCSAGDTLDVVPSKECNGITKESEFYNTDQTENCDAKATKSFITQSRNSSRCRSSYSHSRRQSPKETSAKLDSVNLLYDRNRDEVDNVKSSRSSEKSNCNRNDRDCSVGRKGQRSNHRNSRCTFATCLQRDNSSSNISPTCDAHCAKHSTLDLQRPHQECCHKNRHLCYHSHNHCHHCCSNEYNSCSSNEKHLTSDTYLCSTNTNDRRGCCRKDHGVRDLVCNHSCHGKDTERISTVHEQNDEELDESVGRTINHKDSLCILVEKYKANKKCKQKAYPDDSEFANEQIKDECDKSIVSNTTCQLDDIMNGGKQGGRYSSRNNNSRASMGKTCGHGCGPIFREGDRSQFKNLKSRLIKTGTCCSAKGTPWRHTF